MILFEEEYKLVLGFYLFDNKKSNDTKEIREFTEKLYSVTRILRSPEIIRYMLAAYKNVDPNFNTITNEKLYKFKEFFLYYQKKTDELKIYYKNFKQGVLNYQKKEKDYKINYTGDAPIAKKQPHDVLNKDYPRNEQVKINALILAGYKCELDSSHVTFEDINNCQYFEGHHLVPLHCYSLFDTSLDVEANVICLCPNCHRKLHYSKNKNTELEILYNRRKNRLFQCGINISFDELKAIYERVEKNDYKN